MAVLRGPAACRHRTDHRLVGRPDCPRPAARFVCDRDGPADQRRGTGHEPHRAADAGRHRLRAPADSRADAPDDQLEPGRSHRRLALRPAHRGVRASTRHRSPRRSGAYVGLDRRARLRPGHDRPAAVDHDGLHRQRPRRADRRAGIGGRARHLHVVGTPPAGRGVARHALSAARERRLARPQYR